MKLHGRKTGRVNFYESGNSADIPSQSHVDFDSDEPDNVVISTILNMDYHRPVLDIDVSHNYVESSTEGHAHLYINEACSWEDYAEFLVAAAKIGLLEQGYVNAALGRKYTCVRLPHVKKGTPA